MEVERLVSLAYGDLPEVHRNGMALETFSSTLGNAYLQRHLLAVQAGTLGEAVRAGNEFLQIRASTEHSSSRSSTAVRTVDEEDGEEPTSGASKDTLTLLLQSMQQLAEAVGKLQAGPKPRPWKKPAPGNGTGPQQ